jgi:CRISPR-associated protein Cas1
MILVVDRRDSILRYKRGCLVLERNNRDKQEIPIQPLEQVVVYGNPLVEAAALRALAQTGTPVVMLALRGKQAAAMQGSGLATQLPIRRLQHRLASHAAMSLELAKLFVQLKAQSYTIPLRVLAEIYHADSLECKAFSNTCRRVRERLALMTSHSAVVGLEGQLARTWFDLLAKNLPTRLKFSGRNRRPPRDPVNALLSLGYTLLLSEVRQAILISGFDPSLGFLHKDYPGRESMALDFIEIFRAGVDCFVLRWLHETEIDAKGFYYRKESGCRMSKSLRPLFFQAWAHCRENWPQKNGRSDDSLNHRNSRLLELIRGELTRVRAFMKQLEKANEQLCACQGHGTRCVE